MLKEFREFAIKGSVVDLAIGVIIGGAFGKIVTSLVNDLIMPPVAHDLGNRASTWSRTLWAVMNKVPAISSGGCRRSEGQRRGARKPKGRGAYLSRGTMVPTGPLDLQPGVPYYAAVAFQDPVIAP